ncbi:MAG TPA: divalent metal cation transporter [Ktedonobacterales bacterium]|nr:divalent metal cation transporter [Ktedonobacterales bacterium]
MTQTLGPVAGALFALFLIDAALIGAAAVTLSTSYAFGDLFNIKHSLHRSLRDGWHFYAIYSVLVLAAAGIVLLPNAPLGLLTLMVQVLAGILLPSATVFLLLLCNDKAVLGPWVNPTWLNILASLIVGVLVELSLILAATTLFPSIDAVALTVWLSVALVFGLLVTGVLLLRHVRRAAHTEPSLPRVTWRMPPLDQLPKPMATVGRTIGLLVLRGYLLIAVVLVAIKFVQLATGH